MARQLARRFPATVLIDYVLSGRTSEDGRPLGSKTLAPELGIMPATLRTWRSQNVYLTVWTADKYATRLGIHPSQLWPDYWDHESDYSDTAVA